MRWFRIDLLFVLEVRQSLLGQGLGCPGSPPLESPRKIKSLKESRREEESKKYELQIIRPIRDKERKEIQNPKNRK